MFDPVLPRLVLAKRWLSADSFVLRLERRNDAVKAGRHVQISLPGSDARAYSLYSGEEDPWLEILIRVVRGGQLTPRLARLEQGDRVDVEAPKGRFTLVKSHPFERLIFVATGTGIAPFRSFLRSNPLLDYTLAHGVRSPQEDFSSEICPASKRRLCVSGPTVGWNPSEGQQNGRVTKWLANLEPGTVDRVYLCGNARMIMEAFEIMLDKGLQEAHIHTETYF